MRTLLFLLIFPLMLSAQSQGVLHLYAGYDENSSYAISLYHSPVDSVPVIKCNVYSYLDSVVLPFEDFAHGWKTYQCAGESPKRWAILDNRKNGKIFWIDKDTLSHFQSWMDFWQYSEMVDCEGMIHKEPFDASAEVKMKSRDEYYFYVDAVQGDWFFVSYGEFHDMNREDPNELYGAVGWIRWRKGNEVFASGGVRE